MSVCVEVYILQNLIMNTLILSLAMRLARQRFRAKRVLASAALGTIYACVSCIQTAAFLRGLLFQAACMLCMCLIALRSLRPSEFLRLWGFCYIAAVLLGGTGFGLMGLLGARGFGVVHALLMMLLGTVGMLALCIPAHGTPQTLTHSVILSVGGKKICLEGFADSGNALREPISGLPVMLVSPESLQIPENGKTRFVPFEAMGTKGLLSAFLPDELLIDGVRKDWFVAAYPGRLSCSALLPWNDEGK